MHPLLLPRRPLRTAALCALALAAACESERVIPSEATETELIDVNVTADEVLRGVTVNAARALGLADRGTIAPGQRADLCLWDLPAPEFLVYQLGGLRPDVILIDGVEQ